MSSDSNARLGPLADLVGTWEGDSGYNVIAVPDKSLESENEAPSFKVLFQKYKETLTFTPVDGTARNRLGVMDQMVGALQYQQVIHAVENPDGNKNDFTPGDLIHQETGMLLFLNNVNGEDDGVSKPPYAIARSGTIPHGNSIMLLGEYPVTTEKEPTLPLSEIAPPTDVGTHVGLGYAELYGQDPSYSRQPNNALKDAIAGQTISKTVTFTLSSANSGAVISTPFIDKYVPVPLATCQYFLETVQKDNGTSFLQLQYSQNVSIVFGKKDADSNITWPHITVNTLTKTSSA